MTSPLLAIAVACLMSVLQGTAADDVDQQLIHHVRRGSAEQVEELLNKGADPNARRKSGLMTALQYAAQGSHLEIMRMLIERGADVNAVSTDGRSPLVEAAGGRTGDAVRLLLDAGAKPTADALAMASWLNNREAVTLLLDAGAPPDGGIVSAAQGGHLDLVKLLLARGADVNARSRDGNTALHTAALQGGVAVVQLLLAQGADPNAVNDRGETPLHMAIHGDGLTENIQLLLKAGADPTVKDKQLVSPVREAAIRQHIPAYQLLLAACDGREPITIAPELAAQYESEQSSDELIEALAAENHSTREQAELALVARGGMIVPDLIRALEAQPETEAYKVLVKLGPQAEPALPILEKLLKNPRYVVIARLTMDGIKPGHFAQLPPPVKQQADAALYQAITDRTSHEFARSFVHWLSEESLLKLLRSQEAEHRSLAVQIATRDGQWSREVEAELVGILLNDDEQTAIRKRTARGLRRSQTLSPEAKAALSQWDR